MTTQKNIHEFSLGKKIYTALAVSPGMKSREETLIRAGIFDYESLRDDDRETVDEVLASANIPPENLSTHFVPESGLYFIQHDLVGEVLQRFGITQEEGEQFVKENMNSYLQKEQEIRGGGIERGI